MSEETKSGSSGGLWGGVCAVLVAVAIAAVALAPHREAPAPSGPVGTPLTPGVRALMTGDWNQADAAFQRAEAQLGADSLEARQLPLLQRVVAVWSVEPLDKDAAAEALRALEAAKPLPPGLTSWIHLQRSKRGLAP